MGALEYLVGWISAMASLWAWRFLSLSGSYQKFMSDEKASSSEFGTAPPRKPHNASGLENDVLSL